MTTAGNVNDNDDDDDATTLCPKKDPRHYRLQLEEGLSDFNNFGANIPDTTGNEMII